MHGGPTRSLPEARLASRSQRCQVRGQPHECTRGKQQHRLREGRLRRRVRRRSRNRSLNRLLVCKARLRQRLGQRLRQKQAEPIRKRVALAQNAGLFRPFGRGRLTTVRPPLLLASGTEKEPLDLNWTSGLWTSNAERPNPSIVDERRGPYAFLLRRRLAARPPATVMTPNSANVPGSGTPAWLPSALKLRL